MREVTEKGLNDCLNLGGKSKQRCLTILSEVTKKGPNEFRGRPHKKGPNESWKKSQTRGLNISGTKLLKQGPNIF